MLEPSLYRWSNTVLNVSCRVRLSRLVITDIITEFYIQCFDAVSWMT